MTEPLPCPFCGHVELSHNEGSTFRWLSTECNGCGAQCGEERINTMTMERSAAIEQAKVAAIKTWNTRFTPFPPQQQAEPVAYFDFQELKFSWAKHMKISPVPVSVKVEPMKLYSESTKRQWVGLTDEDFLEACQLAERGNYLLALQRIQIKLKERNT